MKKLLVNPWGVRVPAHAAMSGTAITSASSGTQIAGFHARFQRLDDVIFSHGRVQKNAAELRRLRTGRWGDRPPKNTETPACHITVEK